MKKRDVETTISLEMITEQLQDTNNLMRVLINYLDNSNDRATHYLETREYSGDSWALVVFSEVNEAPIRVTLAYDALQKLQDQIKKLNKLTKQVTDKGEKTC